MRNGVAVLAMLALIALMLGTGSAQLGEVAGKVHFNVTPGSANTLQMIVFNAGSGRISFVVVSPRFEPSENESPPTVTVFPRNGTLGPRQDIDLNITILAPRNATPGTNFSGVVEVIQVSANTTAGGAQVNPGVAKIITATIMQPPPGPSYYALLAIGAAALVVAAAVILFKRRGSTRSRRKRR